jgi:hypothetical protein
MKALGNFVNRWQWAVLTLITYEGIALSAVVTAWLSQVGAERFNAMVQHPVQYAYDLAILIAALIGAACGSFRSLLNGDLQDAKDVKEANRGT